MAKAGKGKGSAGKSDGKRDELIAKVSAFVRRRFGGDWHEAFLAYSGGKPTIGKPGILRLLEEADVWTAFWRRVLSGGVVAELDADGDGEVSEAELETAIKGGDK
jgi:hypothetical protein